MKKRFSILTLPPSARNRKSIFSCACACVCVLCFTYHAVAPEGPLFFCFQPCVYLCNLATTKAAVISLNHFVLYVYNISFPFPSRVYFAPPPKPTTAEHLFLVPAADNFWSIGNSAAARPHLDRQRNSFDSCLQIFVSGLSTPLKLWQRQN